MVHIALFTLVYDRLVNVLNENSKESKILKKIDITSTSTTAHRDNYVEKGEKTAYHTKNYINYRWVLFKKGLENLCQKEMYLLYCSFY